MEIDQIKVYLQSDDSQDRLKALTELRNYGADVAVPLLKSRIRDREFLVRSFVAMGLGKKQTAESFAALLELIQFDPDPNVRAEAANSLSLYGEVAAPHIVSLFHRDSHWLIRRSILAALFELNCPEELFDVCLSGLGGDDFTVREACIDGLAFLADSVKHGAALEKLLTLVDRPSWRIRARVAKALNQFKEQSAQDALNQLRQDQDHRVVGAVLDGLI